TALTRPSAGCAEHYARSDPQTTAGSGRLPKSPAFRAGKDAHRLRAVERTLRSFPMGRADVLAVADWVEAHLDDPNVVIVEVDEDTSAYDKGHIRNAIKLDWRKDLQDPVRSDFVDKAGFEALMSERGIANDHTVVLYGGNNNWFA